MQPRSAIRRATRARIHSSLPCQACAVLIVLLSALAAGQPAPPVERSPSPHAAPAPVNLNQHWSLRPLSKPPLPEVKNKAWAATPVDRFVLARLEEKQIQPNAPADKRTLLRRLCFDLIGLPPSPEELAAFLSDESADAYERVVDRLLASPRYGERWARHWLDEVHYAETHGHDQDRVRTNAWPYRDYVIRSLNEDKPYARFVEEQTAGDALYPGDPQSIVALGFLATGPWDESSLRDIREDTIDRQIARYLDRDDIVMTVMNTFISTTVQCARCHNHKFDPISQAEYYGLQAVFASTDKAERDYDPDPGTHALRKELLKKKSAIERKENPVLDSLSEPSFQREFAAWEKGLTNRPIPWTALMPATFTSSGGATLAKQPDGSMLAGGMRPETDTYTITASTELKGITAVRLEVLSDPSLPHRGPGRQDNGNLHLTDFRMKAAPEDDTNATATVTLQNPTADFNQQDWDIAKAIDSDPKTAWGIYPEVGRDHQAVFEIKDPVGFAGGAALTFTLDQNHGGGHLIGRPRLSVTTAAPPVSINLWPDNVAKILATPLTQRSDEQKIELGLYYLKAQVEHRLAALPPPQRVYAGASYFAPD